MKKLLLTGLIAATFVAVAPKAKADLEISGAVDVVAGYQRDDKNADTNLGLGGLTQGDFVWSTGSRADHFGFAVDSVEIDLAKEFGENIRLRADIDFRDLGNGSGVNLEQGYVTANIPIGSGMEFLIGKFNSPIGLESVDRWANTFITYTQGYTYLIPTNVIGAKFYYAFNDNWSIDFGIVNDMNGNITGDSMVPVGLVRVGAQWGEEGNESYIHLGGYVGPEQSTNSDLDMFANLWGNWAIGDTWDIPWEVTYRASQADENVFGANNDSTAAFAAQLAAIWHASDAWDIQVRGSWFWDYEDGFGATHNGGASRTGSTWSGFQGMSYSGTLGASYWIAEGAKFKMEYRLDYASLDNDTSNVGSDRSQMFHTAVVEFAYTF